jgi:small subunit ribosomal protein S10
VPKSPFVHKKSQENFQRKEHKRAIKVYDASRASVDLWLRYLKQHAVGGVGVRAEVYEWIEVGQVGREMEVLEGELAGEGVEKREREQGKGQGQGDAPAESLGDKVKGVVSDVKEKAEELVKELSKKAP